MAGHYVGRTWGGLRAAVARAAALADPGQARAAPVRARSRAIVCLCPSARTIAVELADHHTMALQHAEGTPSGPVTYTTRGDATPIREGWWARWRGGRSLHSGHCCAGCGLTLGRLRRNWPTRRGSARGRSAIWNGGSARRRALALPGCWPTRLVWPERSGTYSRRPLGASRRRMRAAQRILTRRSLAGWSRWRGGGCCHVISLRSRAVWLSWSGWPARPVQVRIQR